MKNYLFGILTALFIGAMAITLIVFSGRINIGADQAHNPLVYKVLETARIKSIDHASQNIPVPDLTEPSMISTGGADYKYMCAGCHLSPTVPKSDLHDGLYPKPPDFTKSSVVARFNTDAGARQGFWAIKHGIMASGMPAWGATHDDERMWAMIAFIKNLPSLDANQYTMLTTSFDDDMMNMSGSQALEDMATMPSMEGMTH